LQPPRYFASMTNSYPTELYAKWTALNPNIILD